MYVTLSQGVRIYCFFSLHSHCVYTALFSRETRPAYCVCVYMCICIHVCLYSVPAFVGRSYVCKLTYQVSIIDMRYVEPRNHMYDVGKEGECD